MVGVLSDEIGQNTLLCVKDGTYIPANADLARFCTVSTCWSTIGKFCRIDSIESGAILN